MKKIGLFGGSFDPVHVDHVNMCKEFKKSLLLDEVIVVPARLSPFKTESGASASDRFEMLRIAFGGINGATVSDYEIGSDGINYSYKTVEFFKEKFPNDELFFLIGADSLESFPHWTKPDVIATNAKICVAGRWGVSVEKSSDEFEKKFGYKPVILDFDGFCSSTEIRERLELGLKTDAYLPKGVCEYITKKGLYEPDKYRSFMRLHSTEKRLNHTVGVMLTAIRYAEATGADKDKAKLAALLHDCAKYLSPLDYPEFSIDSDVPKPVVHQYLGAYVAKNVLGVNDEEILSAIACHTTGKPEMSLLDKIILTADLLEPARSFDGVEELRAAVDADFESGFRLCVHRLLQFLNESGEPVYRLTEMTDKYYNS